MSESEVDSDALEQRARELASQVQQLVQTSVNLHDLRRALEEREKTYKTLSELMSAGIPEAPDIASIAAQVVEFVAYTTGFECVLWASCDGLLVHEGFWDDPEAPERIIEHGVVQDWCRAKAADDKGLMAHTSAANADVAALSKELGLIEGAAHVLVAPTGHDPMAFLLYGCTADGARTSARLSDDRFRTDVITTLASSVATTMESRKNYEGMQAAVEEAKRASQAKSRFVANMTHELRTPLNAITGYTELVREELEDRGLGDAFGEELGRIVQSSAQLLHLVNDVLDLAKIEAGAYGIHIESFDICNLADDVLAQARPAAAEQSTRLVLEAPGPHHMTTDRARVRQILANLVSNAIKFTHDGTVTLAILVEAETVSLSVDDTGVGMNDEALNRIFRPFEQEDNSTTRRYGGTGLGLHITRQLAQRLGGDITVTSARGEGSCFVVRLPNRAPEAR